jgi:hypothetical protein
VPLATDSNVSAQLMNKNRRHLHCPSLVQAYCYRSWLQSTFPSILNNFDLCWIQTELFVATGTNQQMLSKSSQWNIAVPTFNIPRRLKAVFVNRINCPSYVTKARHLASPRKRPCLSWSGLSRIITIDPDEISVQIIHVKVYSILNISQVSLKGHSQLAHMRIRYHFIANLHTVFNQIW